MTVLAACGGSSAASTDPSSGPIAPDASDAPTETLSASPIVGRWVQVHTCDQLVRGLEEHGLGETAPAVVGDYLRDVSADELASKEDLCSGAKPQRHLHFFDTAGMFGSLDQHEQQVDDGAYAVDGDLLHIGDGTWRFEIAGDELSLEPVITRGQVRQALARPLEWSTAGWVVAVAYPGTTWQRVPCKGWCWPGLSCAGIAGTDRTFIPRSREEREEDRDPRPSRHLIPAVRIRLRSPTRDDRQMAEAVEEILGRDAELAEVEAFVRSIPNGPTALLLEGIAGIGKTTLWLAGVRTARASGCRVLSSRGAEAEATLSYTALGDLLDGVLDEISTELPSPQRRALDTALLRSEVEGSPPDQRAVSLACVGALRSVAASGPLVIAIDDIQWLDAPSARVLSFALRRLREEPVGAMVSRRVSYGNDGDPLGIERAIPATRVRRLRVGPLSVGALGRLLRTRTGADLTRPVAGRLHRISGGNPFFALEMARAILRHGARLEPGAPLPVPEDLQQLLGSRLATLPRSARDALLIVASVARPSEDLVIAAADGADRAKIGLANAQAAGIIERTGGRIGFSHPLFGSAVYGSASPRRRRALHLRLAALVTDPEEHARHLALAASRPDREVARALDEAASHSRARGAPDSAAELAELATRLTPPEEVDAIRRRSIEAAEYHFDAGDATRAENLLDEAIATSPPGAERARTLYRRASISWMNLARVEPLLEQARVEAANEPELLAGIHQDLAWVGIYQGDLASASRHVDEAALHAERLVDPAIRGDLLSTLGMVAFLSGRPTQDAMSEAVRLQDLWMREGSWTEASVYTTPRTCLGLQRMYAGELDAARAAFEHELAEYAKHAAYTVRQEVLCYLAELECRAGRWQVAAGYADEAGEILAETGHMEGGSSLVHFAHSLVAAHTGQTDVARREATEGAELSLSNDDPFFGSCCRAVLGFVELSVSNHEKAHEHLAPAVRYVERMGTAEPGVIPCVPDDIEALVALGRLDEAETLLERLEEQGRALDRPWALATAARCRGLLLAARADLTEARSALARALVEHERVPQPFELARTLLVAGEVERRARQKRSARSFLERAVGGFDRLGASGWSAKASAALDRVGGPAAARAELTPTEQRVASLVADGKTNREVADALFVTVKTVEANLSRIFHKLGLRSRKELIRAMAVASGQSVRPDASPTRDERPRA